jgi:hypothetical protein
MAAMWHYEWTRLDHVMGRWVHDSFVLCATVLPISLSPFLGSIGSFYPHGIY